MACMNYNDISQNYTYLVTFSALKSLKSALKRLGQNSRSRNLASGSWRIWRTLYIPFVLTAKLNDVRGPPAARGQVRPREDDASSNERFSTKSREAIRKISARSDVRDENGSGAQHWPIGVTW